MDKNQIIYQAEANSARLERTIVRLWILVILMILMLLGTNFAWIYYENQFEDMTTTIESEQEASDGGTNYVIGGDYDKTEGKNNN